jgi:hypothetical protein
VLDRLPDVREGEDVSTWIPAHDSLRDHPKRRRLSRRLGIDEHATLGLLLCFWWWCLDYAPDGDLAEFEPEDVAEGMGWAGDATVLLDTMRECGFIEGTAIHDWDDYAGKLYRKRESDAERKRQGRKQPKTDTSNGRPTDVLRPSQVEERRGEEKRKNTLAQIGNINGADFSEFWTVYPRKVGKGAAVKAWGKAIKKASAREIIRSLSEQLPALKEKTPEFIPHPATWLNAERWADEGVSLESNRAAFLRDMLERMGEEGTRAICTEVEWEELTDARS